MIETRIGPASRRVAVAAFLATAAFVMIVFSVTAEAGRRRVLECLVLVASTALGLHVLADQRILGCVVIKFHVQPRCRRMAIATLGTHRFTMDVVRLMAGEAFGLRLAMLCARFMAIGTRRLDVLAEQGKVRHVVIKPGLIELHDIGIPTFVIGVAVGAGLATGSAVKTVKTGPRFDVGIDVLVAVQAQRTLF